MYVFKYIVIFIWMKGRFPTARVRFERSNDKLNQISMTESNVDYDTIPNVLYRHESWLLLYLYN